MTNTIVYTAFFTAVQESIAEGTFAKLTFTKTVGKPELLNIYVRTTVAEGVLKLAVTFKSYNEGLQEVEKIIALEELEAELTPYINNPFMWLLLFTTDADITLKLNKKRNAAITELPPTFKNPDATLVAYRTT